VTFSFYQSGILRATQAHSAWPSLSAWVVAVSTVGGFGYRWERNGIDCWYTGLSRLKALNLIVMSCMLAIIGSID